MKGITHLAFSTMNKKGPTDVIDNFLKVLFLTRSFWDPRLNMEHAYGQVCTPSPQTKQIRALSCGGLAVPTPSTPERNALPASFQPGPFMSCLTSTEWVWQEEA